MTRALLTVVTLAVFSVSAWAEGYAYQARIEGMVCAFCAYNVGKTIGAIASTQGMRVVIEAPEDVEIDLLMPILMGRKPAINVRFVPTDVDSIHLKMFAASNGT